MCFESFARLQHLVYKLHFQYEMNSITNILQKFYKVNQKPALSMLLNKCHPEQY